MRGLIFAAVIFFGLWGGSAWWLLQQTQFGGWVKYVHVVAAFPLLLVLITLNVVLAGQIAPSLLDLVAPLGADGWSSKVAVAVVFVAAAPLAVAILYLWIKLLQVADRVSRTDKKSG